MNGCSHLQPPQALDFPSQPEQGFDRAFFRATGIVMIVGTLMLGAITFSLATQHCHNQTCPLTTSTLAME
jgi:hypothetical protein